MRTCTRCGDTYTVHTHSYTGTTVAPTCTESGYTLYECDCGYSYQGDETAATGHNYTQTVVAPTCTEGGYTQYTCACGHSYQGDETAATGHTYTQTVVAPTCIKTGYTLHQCTCGHSYQSDPTPALGHNYLKTVYPQYIYFYCSRCGDSYTVPIGGLQPIQPKPPIEYMSLDGEETDNAGTDSTERVLVSEVVITYSYVYNGGNLMQETVVTEITTDEGSTVSAETLDYTHGFGGPSALTWRDDTYYYAANLQGDVIAILDDAGNPVVEYTYDAWGNILTITGPMADTLGVLNPLTYRGYVYDHETGLYYLQSRYYNPEIGRFLNADALVSTGQGLLGNNMFAYCGNNPLNYSDSSGYFSSRATASCIALTDGSSAGGIMDIYKLQTESFATSGTTLYYSAYGAVSAWADKYRPLSAKYEYVSLLYGIETVLGMRYFTTNAIRGYEGDAIFAPNTIVGTVALWLQDSISSATCLGQVHSHPDVPNGYCNSFPSFQKGIYGGDRIAMETFGFLEMYIVPYSRHNCPAIIIYSDRSTWCSCYQWVQ